MDIDEKESYCPYCGENISLLIDKNLSGLPPFLVDKPGLNSGFMILLHIEQFTLK